MKAKIYKSGKSAMQSGRGKLDFWILEYEPLTSRKPEPLMGWASAGDTLAQVHLKFPSQVDAESFAKKEGLDYVLLSAHERRIKPRNYGDNFRYFPPEDQEKA